MTKLLLTQYRLEYETDPDITVEEIVTKYKLDINDLKGHEEWARGGLSHGDHVYLSDIVPSEPTPVTIVGEGLQSSIDSFKRQALEHCLKFMSNDARFAEIKEFKDIVAVVDSIEKSIKGTSDTGPTVNIVIQNLAEKFKDDC